MRLQNTAQFNWWRALVLLALAFTPAACPGESFAVTGAATKARTTKFVGKLPLSFELNEGQTDPQVQFLSRGRGFTLFLTSTQAVLDLKTLHSKSAHFPETEGDSPSDPAIRMVYVGANPKAKVSGLEQLQGKVNYFIGNDSRKWRQGLPAYRQVKYTDLYPGVDLIYYSVEGQLEYDFVLAPGADPATILLRFDGVDRLEVDAAGDLVLYKGGRQIRQHRPVIFQEIAGVRRKITGGYVIRDRQEIGFAIGEHDPAKTLFIDPVLSYSTYLGGGAFDQGSAIAVDSQGNAYVTGRTASVDYPTEAPLQADNAGSFDVFVAKLNPSGDTLLYSTFIGGVLDDEASGIAVDASGNAYVTGFTDSSNFPTANPLQPLYGGSRDGFVFKLNADGSAFEYSTFLGGSGFEISHAIAIDSSGNAYVGGSTLSANFPLASPLQGSLLGTSDAFVTKLNAAGSALVYSTYLGGSSFDSVMGIAVDSSGKAYVAGDTGSTDFPTANPIQGTYGGGFLDAIVAKLDADGSALKYSTYLGGSGEDGAHSIALDSNRNAYVTGRTHSTNFPTANALQPTLSADAKDAFVTKLNSRGSALVYSTYLPLTESGNGIAVDSGGNAYVTGSGCCVGSSDAFVTKLNSTGSAALYSIQLGGLEHDVGSGIAVDAFGDAYVTGETSSAEFPTANPLQPDCSPSPENPERCSIDAFVAKISEVRANAGPDQKRSAGDGCLATVSLDGTTSKDPNDLPLNFLWQGPFGTVTGSNPIVSLPLGRHIITLTVDNGQGEQDSDTVVIKVVDTAPPVISSLSANPSQLWPPDGRLVSVAIAAAVSDNCDANTRCRIVSVSSNERSHGNSSPDWIITGRLAVELRAEQSRQDRLRVYTIRVRCRDASGRYSHKTIKVAVSS